MNASKANWDVNGSALYLGFGFKWTRRNQALAAMWIILTNTRKILIIIDLLNVESNENYINNWTLKKVSEFK